MKRTILLAALLFQAAITCTVRAGEPIDNLPLFGAMFDISERRGYLDFGSGRTEAIDRRGMVTGGVMFGKRWHLAGRLRLQAAATIQYGSVATDTLPLISLTNGTADSTLLETALFHGGCIVEIQCPFKVAPDGQWFLLAGGGVHVARYRENELLLGNSNTKLIGDPYVEGDHVTVGASVHGGLGFEIIVSPLFGIAATYSLRYWYPIRYGLKRDFFPVGPVDYRERFLSHEFRLMVLVKR
jgi:hypothetical protein